MCRDLSQLQLDHSRMCIWICSAKYTRVGSAYCQLNSLLRQQICNYGLRPIPELQRELSQSNDPQIDIPLETVLVTSPNVTVLIVALLALETMASSVRWLTSMFVNGLTFSILFFTRTASCLLMRFSFLTPDWLFFANSWKTTMLN